MKGISKGKLEQLRNSPCWEWPSTISPNGYGKRIVNGKQKLIHRLTYASIFGEIEQKMHCDHLCRNKKCCNPWHIEVVTARENILRGVGASAINFKKKKCKHGHKLSSKNTYVNNGWRTCRTCKNERMRRYRREKRSSRS
ncbi:MAG: HNH endonuclease signature motif containing protein [Paracoccaceae bacterium]